MKAGNLIGVTPMKENGSLGSNINRASGSRATITMAGARDTAVGSRLCYKSEELSCICWQTIPVVFTMIF
jgi:hypothetical protein